jgi:uncharacterized protein YbjQ (UPF0145 family)
MIYTSTSKVRGRAFEEILCVVTGNVVQTKHIGRDIMASLTSIVGGEIITYTEMLMESRLEVISRLVQSDLELDADAVVSRRFTTCAIMKNASEVLAYGNAVKLRSKEIR